MPIYNVYTLKSESADTLAGEDDATLADYLADWRWF